MSVKFTEVTEEVRQQLQRSIQSSVVRGFLATRSALLIIEQVLATSIPRPSDRTAAATAVS